MATYKYLALGSPTTEIRLLTLHPGTLSDEVRISIFHETLSVENPIRFDALSYTWGMIDDPVLIAVDDKFLTVTQNLSSALVHLRLADEPRRLWIDAICIDQLNLTERSEQVVRMGDIYRSAVDVVVWLGPEADESTKALEALSVLASRVMVDWDEGTSHRLDKNEDLYGIYTVMCEDPQDSMGLKKLFDRSWFKRLWVWQEVQLARYAIVMCGSFCMPWDEFRNAVKYISSRRNSKSSDVVFSDQLFLTIDSRLKYIVRGGAKFSLNRLLDHTTNCLYTDPRDRIYALLSFQSQEDPFRIVPDYSKSVCEVYKDFVLAYITRKRRIEVLMHCEMRPIRSELPSWVPDWSFPKLAPRALACGNSSGLTVGEAEEIEPGVLAISGVTIDAVAEVTSCIRTATSMEDAFTEVKSWEPPNVMEASYIGGGSLLDAYSCTLICGQVSERMASHDDFYPSLNQCIDSFLCHVRCGPGTIIARDWPARRYCNLVASNSKGRRYFTTKKGYIGLGPAELQVGDQVVVLLGLTIPMCLRATVDGKRFQIVGGCYVHALMDAEGLLGPVPHPWKIEAKKHTRINDLTQFVDSETGEVASEDPRLGPLPFGWTEKPRADRRGRSWKDTATGARTSFDPRLRISELRLRGVVVDTFHCV